MIVLELYNWSMLQFILIIHMIDKLKKCWQQLVPSCDQDQQVQNNQAQIKPNVESYPQRDFKKKGVPQMIQISPPIIHQPHQPQSKQNQNPNPFPLFPFKNQNQGSKISIIYNYPSVNPQFNNSHLAQQTQLISSKNPENYQKYPNYQNRQNPQILVQNIVNPQDPPPKSNQQTPVPIANTLKFTQPSKPIFSEPYEKSIKAPSESTTASTQKPKKLAEPLSFPFEPSMKKVNQKTEEALNDKFENTVTGSEAGDLMKYEQKDLQDIYANGLQNVGNTCYLNSILQMLYSAEKLRKLVVNLAGKSDLPFHRLVANIFQDITNKQSQEKKRGHLLQLVRYIEGSDPKFARFKQNDAIECLMTVLNLLEEEDKNTSKLNYFKIKYEPHCGCTKNGNAMLLQNYYVNNSQTCITCKQNISFNILNSGPFLIVMPNAQNFKFRQMIKFANKGKEQLFYENKCFVTHYGTQHSGHYIAHRKIQGKWFEISDSYVSQTNFQSIKHIPMITLYAFKKRKAAKL